MMSIITKCFTNSCKCFPPLLFMTYPVFQGSAAMIQIALLVFPKVKHSYCRPY